MEDPIRCPYCVYRDEFKIMISLGTCFVSSRAITFIDLPNSEELRTFLGK